MRSIKFRAWENTSESMVYDVQNISRKRIIGESACESFQEVLDSWEYETMQFTGLYDKHGNEIYEGDVYHMGDPNITYTVVWHDTGLIGKQNGASSYVGLSHWQRRIEIIGNIYEHPHLLENQLN